MCIRLFFFSPTLLDITVSVVTYLNIQSLFDSETLDLFVCFCLVSFIDLF